MKNRNTFYREGAQSRTKGRSLKLLFVLMTVILLSACNNFFHDLVPNNENRIVSFEIPGQLYSEIFDNEIIVIVPQGMSLNSITPTVRVSPGATPFPVTFDYVSRSFGDERTFGAVMQIYAGGNMTENVIDMIADNRSFIRPEMDLPIDFRHPVDFLVIAGLGTVRQYTVRVVVDTGEGKFNSFSFEKFFNPDLTVQRTTGTINDTAKTVTINVMYPVENIASYELIPSFATNNARVFLGETEIINNVSVLQFEKPEDHVDLVAPNRITQEKTLILKRTGYDDVTWTLTVNFSEDPDTSRAITDFRFIRSRNPLIAADYMADITNSGNTGTINVTVYYSGAKPDELRADFVSPGTVRVNGDTQQSGMTFHTFSAPLSYVVTSRDGSNTRTYTVTVNMLPASDPLPQITSFTLDISRNSQLKSNSTALIDHNARLIIIEAAYDGASPPYSLRPQFTATGNVTVNGVNQTSGSTYNNFSGAVTYTVTNPSNPTLRRDYRVEVVFVQALSSVAEITSMIFYKADNPDLIADTTATINQGTGAISATLLFETPGGNRTLIARWSSQGTVDSNGVIKYNMDQRQFYTPVNYRAVSQDGVLQKNYTLTVREINSRMFIRQGATGRGDGTSWENAHTHINQATYLSIARNHLIEVWIAEGIYYRHSSYTLSLAYDLLFIGGFIGNENSLSERTDIRNRRAVIRGEMNVDNRTLMNINAYYGGIVTIQDLILSNAASDSDGPLIDVNGSEDATNTTVIIRGVDFSNSSADRGGAISLWGNFTKIIEDCNFYNHQSRAFGAIWSNSGNLTINNCTFNNTQSVSGGGAIGISSGISAIITNNNFINTSSSQGNAIYFQGTPSSSVTLNNNNFNGMPDAIRWN